MDASIQYQTQIVGALPAITAYFDKLDLAATVDRLVPWEGEIPLGTLVEVLITNRLLRPKALFRIGDWAEAAAVTDCYDLTAAQLNDDRLGRALERLPRYAETIQAALTLKAIERFQLDVHQIHYDISNVELYGAYEDFQRAEGQETTVPVPAYGRTKSGRKNVKPIQFGLDVTGDGGVPVGHLPLDGNTAEVNSHLENLKRLGQILPKGRLLDIADTKLDAPENLLAIAARGRGAVPQRRGPLASTPGAVSSGARPPASRRLLPSEPGQAPAREARRLQGPGGHRAPGGPGRWAASPARLPVDLRLE